MNCYSKRIILCIIALSSLSLVWLTAHAYEPTANDITLTWTLTNRLMDALEKKKRSAEDSKKIENRLSQLAATPDASLAYVLSTSSNYLASLRTQLKDWTYFKNLHLFIDAYWKDVQTPWDSGTTFDRCFNQYAIVDDYARQIKVPTAFILATWFIETSCRMENPANRDGLFQIINNDYEPGPITVADLSVQLQHFGAFLQRKWNRYNSKQPAPIQLSHNSFNLNTLQTFGALYNGLAWDFTAYPLDMWNPYYFYGNYNADFANKRDGRLVTFMKILKREATKFGK